MLFVPVFVHNLSAYDCHLIFEKQVSMASEKGTTRTREDVQAKLSENYSSVEMGCSSFSNSISSWMLVYIKYPPYSQFSHL